jgi:hypothetical protein
MLLGIAIAALISAFVPNDFFAGKIFASGILSMLIMVALGVPVYVCATASIPIAAALIVKGLSPGAALVFLITGPATNAASFMTIWKVLNGRTAIIYLATVIVCAITSGLLLDFLFPNLKDNITEQLQHIHHSPLTSITAIVLLILLGYALLFKKENKNNSH